MSHIHGGTHASQIQRNEFARQLSEQLNIPLIETSDWATLFSLLGRLVQNEHIIILFDQDRGSIEGQVAYCNYNKLPDPYSLLLHSN